MDTAGKTNPLISPSKSVASSLRYRRIVMKAGTSVLTASSDKLHMPTMKGLVEQIASLHRQGTEVLLVTSGAIAAGMKPLDVAGDRSHVPFRQVLAAVGQNRLMQAYSSLFESWDIPVAQALLTRRDLEDRQGYLNVRNTLLSLLDHRVVPIINENDVVAVDEIGSVFGDNDTLSALVANLVDADLLVILTDADGLFTADPRTHPEAELLPKVERIDSYIESLAGGHHSTWSRGGMPSKLEAAKVATRSGVTVVICNGRLPDVVPRIAGGESLGTLFTPTASKVESRKRWMLSGLSVNGDIVIDQGAEKALREQNRSLLPAGVKDVCGDFQRGDVVYITSLEKERLACGLVNYSAAEVARIKGHRSDSIQEILGCHYGQEVVHRNNMVLM